MAKNPAGEGVGDRTGEGRAVGEGPAAEGELAAGEGLPTGEEQVADEELAAEAGLSAGDELAAGEGLAAESCLAATRAGLRPAVTVLATMRTLARAIGPLSRTKMTLSSPSWLALAVRAWINWASGPSSEDELALRLGPCCGDSLVPPATRPSLLCSPPLAPLAAMVLSILCRVD